MIDSIKAGKRTVVDAFYDFIDEYMERPEALPIDEIARRATISRMYFYKLRKRQSVPSLDVAENIANAMGTSLAKILNMPVKVC